MKSFQFYTSILLLAAISLLIAACHLKHPDALRFNDITYAAALNTAKKNGKGIFFISKIKDCSMCEYIELDLLRDKEFADAIYKDYIIVTVDRNTPGSEWLSRDIYSSAAPTFAIVDNNGDVKGIWVGVTPKKKILGYIEQIAAGKKMLERFSLTDSDTLRGRTQMVSIQAMFDAQKDWDEYNATQSLPANNKLEENLKKSIAIFPYFYNNYLLAKYYAIQKDAVNATNYAMKTLEFADAKSAGMFHSLRKEMNLIIDPAYSEDKEPLALVDSTVKALGNIKEGQSKVIKFQIKNVGAQKMMLSKAYSDCPCTIAKPLQDSIMPGKTGEIQVTYTGKTVGSFNHMILVHSNAANPMLQLHVTGVTY
ncbi:DUF1573 domain-containing protein [Chitinophaga sp. Hz27]|uniref:DUF1573 domain-containing protein n=1 Tax=Chitinophaga sp. Hz27 TaxID=3347169 RepID=UPI0035DC0B87